MNQGALQLWLLLCFVWLITTQESNQPRDYVPYADANVTGFTPDGVLFFSTLVRDNLSLVFVGASDHLFALDRNNISNVLAKIEWKMEPNIATACLTRGNSQMFCRNHVRVVQFFGANRLFICGTYGGIPRLRYVIFENNTLTPERDSHIWGRCPLDHEHSTVALMVGRDLFEAIFTEAGTSKPLFYRTFWRVRVTTNPGNHTLKDPKFASISLVEKSKFHKFARSGHPDEVYLFFSEDELDSDWPQKSRISRVARVCRDDIGGLGTPRWTSYMKAKMNCPVMENDLPYLIQDAYVWCLTNRSWEECMIYATFIPQLNSSEFSGVCVYSLSEVDQVLVHGNFRQGHVRRNVPIWVEDNPKFLVRPGRCIDNELRKSSSDSRNIPSQTHNYVLAYPMKSVIIEPIERRPLLIHKGAFLTSIVVTEFQAWDQTVFRVMFMGTEKGTVLKALHSPVESYIIEEVQVTPVPEVIKDLKYLKGLLYATTSSGVYQFSPAYCGRSKTCLDCLLSRDPYCGWDIDSKACVRSNQKDLLRTVEFEDMDKCSLFTTANYTLDVKVYSYVKLDCTPPSKYAKLEWEKNDLKILPSSHIQPVKDALVIYNFTVADIGLYRCIAVVDFDAGLFRSVARVYKLNTRECAKECYFKLQEQKETFMTLSLWLYISVPILAVVSLAFVSHFLYKYFKLRCLRRAAQSLSQGSYTESRSNFGEESSIALDSMSLSLGSQNTTRLSSNKTPSRGKRRTPTM